MFIWTVQSDNEHSEIIANKTEVSSILQNSETMPREIFDVKFGNTAIEKMLTDSSNKN